MALVYGLIGGITLILAALAWLAVCGRARLSFRVGAVAALVIGIALGFIGIPELLGRPKPIDQIWLEKDELKSRLIAAHFTPDVGIFLWIIFPGEDKPRAYELPWKRRLAEKIEETMSQAGRRGLDVEIGASIHKWALFDAGDFPVTIVPPPRLRHKTPPNQPLRVKPGKPTK